MNRDRLAEVETEVRRLREELVASRKCKQSFTRV